MIGFVFCLIDCILNGDAVSSSKARTRSTIVLKPPPLYVFIPLGSKLVRLSLYIRLII